MDTSSLGLSLSPPLSSSVVVEFVTDHTGHRLSPAISASAAEELSEDYDYFITEPSAAPSTTPSPHDDRGGGGDEAGAFQMAYSADVAWTVIFSSMIMSAIIGNLVVFWIVLGRNK